jgi:hypothetical protein
MKTFQAAYCIAMLIAPIVIAQGQDNSWTNEIPAEEARGHLHERAAVFGKVFHVSWDSNVYFDFDGVYSQAVFTAVLRDAPATAAQFATLEGKEIVVHGRITTNSFGIPQIRVKTLDNILVVGADNHAVPLNLDSAQPAPHSNPAPRQDPASWLSVFAADPDETNMFVTLSGRTYEHSKVIRVEPDGITIKYAPGGSGLSETKLSFDELPASLQQMYGFDPQIAAAYINEKERAADLADVEKRRKAWRARREELMAEAAANQILFERKKRDYEDEKKDYDEKMRRGEWHDAERLAANRELQIREAEYQSAVQQQQLIQQQQQLMLNQQTNQNIVPGN